MKAKALVVALCCTLGVAAPVFAKGQMPMGKVLRQLDLTEEQKTQIQQLRNEQREAGQTQKDAMTTAREAHKAAMQALMTNPTFDEDEAARLIDERNAHQKARSLEKMRAHHAVMQVLTPQQQTQFIELMEQKMEKQKERGGKKGKKGNKGEKGQNLGGSGF
ncbi:Spy/CpxP family protein refolding chaperone [Neiella sp. HB171785]|uniref:Spy/CpxP family protein refolding chaperone n=1 Tax=Neiella litorisoli TaxID=2771431 RepID=A0A8J6UGI8_9GAMM|nr:Spy/CpxP family protein refolding chaperone [Neiella litorisoli]MBD1390211.1 Spy/CpxP family protein refolding chaperone [Neiella litorisoli]